MDKTTVQIKKISPLSVGKVFALMYVIFGLIVGAIFSCFSLIGGAAVAAATGEDALGMLFGVGSIIILPIMYGIMGFIGGVISAFIYNLVAGWVGGIEMELG